MLTQHFDYTHESPIQKSLSLKLVENSQNFFKPDTSLQCPMNPTTEGVRNVFCYSRFCLPLYHFVDLQCRLTRSPHVFVQSVASVWSFYHNPKLISLRISIFNFYISIPFVCYTTLRTGLLNCLNARSRGLTFRHRASCI